jgi:hypothetical protein
VEGGGKKREKTAKKKEKREGTGSFGLKIQREPCWQNMPTRSVSRFHFELKRKSSQKVQLFKGFFTKIPGVPPEKLNF